MADARVNRFAPLSAVASAPTRRKGHNKNDSQHETAPGAGIAVMVDPGADEFRADKPATRSLGEVAVGESVIVREVLCTPAAAHEGGDVGLRLLELGFVEGERLRVVARGLGGGEPIAVRVGATTFALRRFEADHVRVDAPGRVSS
jgi:ferrous iron transport protein A